MKPLIEITTVPIQIEMKTTNAKLEYARGTAEMEITRDNGNLQIKSRPIKVNIDTFVVVQRNLKHGVEGFFLMMETKIGEELITKFAGDAMMKDVKTNVGLQFLPDPGPEITWDPGEMNIRYEMDKLAIDWKLNEGSFEFTPGDIEFTIAQRPDVVIKYIGGPIYVPPSADPNYEPVDVKV